MFAIAQHFLLEYYFLGLENSFNFTKDDVTNQSNKLKTNAAKFQQTSYCTKRRFRQPVVLVYRAHILLSAVAVRLQAS